MLQITHQEDPEKWRCHRLYDFETGLNREERYLLNLWHMRYVEKLEADLQESIRKEEAKGRASALGREIPMRLPHTKL